MSDLDNLYLQFEIHSPHGIKKCFEAGIDPNLVFDNVSIFEKFYTFYTRSPRFSDCVKVFVDYGLNYQDTLLLTVFLDDDTGLNHILEENPNLIHQKYSFTNTFTQMIAVSLLHICAEYNLVKCGNLLLQKGLNVNIKAGVDEHGFGGQSAIFHTVNQNENNSKEMMDLLLAHGANLNVNVIGLYWGKGYEWETFIPAVNPISYAMMGNLPQMHRDEKTIADTVSILTHKCYGIDFKINNVPNKYLINE